LKNEIEKNNQKLNNDANCDELNYLFNIFAKGIDININYDNLECVLYNNKTHKICGKAVMPSPEFSFRVNPSNINAKLYDFELDIDDLSNASLIFKTLKTVLKNKLKIARLLIEPCMEKIKKLNEKKKNESVKMPINKSIEKSKPIIKKEQANESKDKIVIPGPDANNTNINNSNKKKIPIPISKVPKKILNDNGEVEMKDENNNDIFCEKEEKVANNNISNSKNISINNSKKVIKIQKKTVVRKVSKPKVITAQNTNNNLGNLPSNRPIQNKSTGPEDRNSTRKEIKDNPADQPKDNIKTNSKNVKERKILPHKIEKKSSTNKINPGIINMDNREENKGQTLPVKKIIKIKKPIEKKLDIEPKNEIK
jgi:hypothetical protein